MKCDNRTCNTQLPKYESLYIYPHVRYPLQAVIAELVYLNHFWLPSVLTSMKASWSSFFNLCSGRRSSQPKITTYIKQVSIAVWGESGLYKNLGLSRESASMEHSPETKLTLNKASNLVYSLSLLSEDFVSRISISFSSDTCLSLLICVTQTFYSNRVWLCPKSHPSEGTALNLECDLILKPK